MAMLHCHLVFFSYLQFLSMPHLMQQWHNVGYSRKETSAGGQDARHFEDWCDAMKLFSLPIVCSLCFGVLHGPLADTLLFFLVLETECA